jgi:putative ABC transport system permease protein
MTRWTRLLGIFVRDARYAARALLKNPRFSAVALVCLALGIGANAAVFSVFNAVLLRPLPYERPDQLGVVFKTSPARNVAVSTFGPAEFFDWNGKTASFESLARYHFWSPTITGVDQSERLTAIRGSGGLLQMLGVRPLAGRIFLPEDEASTTRVVVLSHRLWQRVFHGDSTLVGRAIRLDGEFYNVLGIMPPAFQFPTGQFDLWSPAAIDPASADRGEIGTMLLARLRSGSSLAQARAELASKIQALRVEHVRAYDRWEAEIVPLRAWYVGASQRNTLWLLVGAVGVVLLIACANVANLLLARGSARRSEILIRLALGASRRRVVLQLLIESLTLGVAGGLLGLLLSVWARKAFLNLLPDSSLYRLTAIDIDWRVLLYALALSLVSAVVFGLVPALRATRVTLTGVHAGRVTSTRLRSTLLVAQTATTVLLLAGAILLVRSFMNIWRIDPGFSRSDVVAAPISLPGIPGAGQTAFYDQLLDRLAAAPDLQAVGAVSNLPLGGGGSSNYISFENRPDLHADQSSQPGAERLSISPALFQTLRIPVLEGRAFTPADSAGAPLVVIVNRTLAARYYPGQSPVGQRIKRGTPTAPFPWMMIVGVVGDVKLSSLLGGVGPTIYLPYAQTPVSAMTVVMRTEAPAATMAAHLQSAVRSINPDQPVGATRPFDDIVLDSLASRRLPMLWIVLFAAMAVALSALGVHGVVSYALQQRAREFAIRLALGAKPANLVSLALRQALVPTAIGSALGLGLAAGLTGLLRSLVFDVSVRDLVSFAIAAALPVLVALVSSYPSARTSAAQNPTMVLHQE